MAIGRRGAMFTVMAIVLALFILSAREATDPYLDSYEVDTTAAQTRVSIMNAYTDTFERYAEQSLRTSAFFALDNLSRKVGTSDAWITDLRHNLSTCLVENLIDTDGDGVLETTCLPPDLNFSGQIENISRLARTELAIETTAVTLYDITITEERPMEVIVEAKIDYAISDSRYASWQLAGRPLRAVIVLEGMRDPLHERMLGEGLVSRGRQFNLSRTRLSQMDPGNFSAFYTNRSYLYHDGRSPSVLQRFAGEHALVSECCGIESVVNVADIAVPINSTWANFSFADHLLFQYEIEGLATPDCAHNEVKSYTFPVGASMHTVTLDAWRYDNTYGLQNTPWIVCAIPRAT